MKPFDIITVTLDDKALKIIDQTLLPAEVKYLHLTALEDIIEAIRALRVRGAPAIGVAAAIGLYAVLAGSQAAQSGDGAALMDELRAAKARLAAARPTAVNLSWALERMERCANDHAGEDAAALLAALRAEALAIRDEDIASCAAIGRHGAALIHDGMGILTHCNAGRLATAGDGTALAPIYAAAAKGVRGLRVHCTETRPLLQGARLTAFELSAAGLDTTLLCENMVDSALRAGRIDIIFVGADRIAANGDVVNKIGTAGIAAIAARYGVPVYCCAPTSTIDFSLATGAQIEIEQRDGSEVTELWYSRRMVPHGIKVYNPAFDLTDHGLLKGIITENGIAKPTALRG